MCRYPCTRIIEGGDSSEAEMQVLMRAVGQGAYAVGQQTRRKGLTSETVFYKLGEAAFLGIGDGVHLAEIALLGVQRGVETEDEAGGYEVDDARGPRDMPPGGAVGKQSLQHLAREQKDMVLVYINIVRHTNRGVVCVDAE